MACLVLLMAGCGGSDTTPGLVPVTGTVTLDGAPLDGAAVTFLPQFGDSERAPRGLTSADGTYELFYANNEPGVKPGAYTVSVSRPIDESETLPAQFNAETTLSADVGEQGGTFDFPLTSK